MFKLQCLFLCVCYISTVSIASLVPFIDKCKWDDKACLLASSQKAVPFLAAGLPDVGVPPLDPVHLDKVVYNEGGLSITFEDMILKGTTNCQIKKVERNKPKAELFLEAECPIEVNGIYTASGKVLVVPIEGHGKFSVKTEKVFLAITVGVDYVEGQGGVQYWQVGKTDYTFEFKEKAYIIFDNLFDGDKEKSDAVNAIFDQNWKDLALTVGKPIVDEVIRKLVSPVKNLTKKVPASELEL